MHWLHNSGALPRIIRFLLSIVLILVVAPFFSMLIYIFPRTIESNQTPAMFDLDYENIVFNSSDGVELKGWFIPSERGEKNASTIIFLHGYPAEKGDMLTFAYSYNDLYNVLMFDFRALGESGGRVSTLGYKEKLDVRAGVDYLIGRGHDDIGIWGFSMGAAAVLMSDLDEVDVIVADSSYAHIDDMSRQVFANLTPGGEFLGDIQLIWARLIFGVNSKDISPASDILNIQQPLLLAYVPGDSVIPASQAEKLRKASKDKSNIDIYMRDTVHHGIMGVEYQKRVRDFFDAYLIRAEVI